jgi:hypothetical protein
MSWLDSEIGYTVPRPQPQPNPPAQAGGINQAGPGAFDRWILVAMFAGLLSLAWYATRGRDDGDQIDVTPLSVLILEETANRGQLSPGQLAAIQSTTIREAVKAKGGTVRVLDVDDKTEALAEPWPTLRRRATLRPPSVVIAGKGRAIEFALPDAETLKQKIEDFQP